LDDSIQVSEQHLTEWGWETGGTGTFLWLGGEFRAGFPGIYLVRARRNCESQP